MSCVKGWIKSDGHRKNLLSNGNICAVAPYKATTGYYFTQLTADSRKGMKVFYGFSKILKIKIIECHKSHWS
jgi:hypothetical protein